MPTPNSSTREAIAAPLSLIDQVFASSAPGATDTVEDAVRDRFRALFPDQASISAIPSLTDPRNVPATKLHPHTLVRFRCMTQDTSLGSELYIPSQTGRDGGRLCSMFREPRAGAGEEEDERDGSHGARERYVSGIGLAEREVVFGVSIPGENAWVRDALDAEEDDEDEDAEGAGGDDEVDGSPIQRLSLAEEDDTARFDTPASERRRTDLGNLEATGQKVPKREWGGVAAVLKFYGMRSEGLKVAEAMEVVGVLDWTHFDPTTSGVDETGLPEEEGKGDGDEGTDVVPCVHVLFHRPAPDPTAVAVKGPRREEALRGLRKYIADKVCGGDAVAAEYLVLAMTSKIHTRVAGLALGALPLNLIHPPSTALDLSSLFKTLLPRTTSSPLTLPLLNSSPFSPTSSPNLGSLSTGLLQLPPCSLLHFDARSMGEGKLVETGLANVRAIEKLAEEGKLGYVFPYDVFEMDADVGLVVSTEGGKTFLKGFWPVHVSAQQTAAPARASWKDIEAWRGLLATARKSRPTVPVSLTSKVQAMFVEARRGAKTADEAEARMGKDDLARIVEVAGGLAKLDGKQEVGEQEVERAGELEAERRRRLLAV